MWVHEFCSAAECPWILMFSNSNICSSIFGAAPLHMHLKSLQTCILWFSLYENVVEVLEYLSIDMICVRAKVPTYVLLMSCSTWDMSPLVTGYILRVLVEMCPQVSRYVQLSCARVKYICQWILFLVQLSWPRPHLVRKISHCPSTKRTTFPSCWVCASPPANHCTMILNHSVALFREHGGGC